MIPRDVAASVIDQTLEFLLIKEGKRMWSNEDMTPTTTELESFRDLSALIKDIIELFAIVVPSIAQDWGDVALEWSTSCPIRHIACRSLQIFR